MVKLRADSTGNRHTTEGLDEEHRFGIRTFLPGIYYSSTLRIYAPTIRADLSDIYQTMR
jgi:hypothetical protein